MARRRMTQTDQRIAIARLDGTARRLLGDAVPVEDAVAALREISTDPQVLARAAGAALGTWGANHVKGWQGRDIADLLMRAGADETLMDQVATHVHERMTQRNTLGS